MGITLSHDGRELFSRDGHELFTRRVFLHVRIFRNPSTQVMSHLNRCDSGLDQTRTLSRVRQHHHLPTHPSVHSVAVYTQVRHERCYIARATQPRAKVDRHLPPLDLPPEVSSERGAECPRWSFVVGLKCDRPLRLRNETAHENTDATHVQPRVTTRSAPPPPPSSRSQGSMPSCSGSSTDRVLCQGDRCIPAAGTGVPSVVKM